MINTIARDFVRMVRVLTVVGVVVFAISLAGQS